MCLSSIISSTSNAFQNNAFFFLIGIVMIREIGQGPIRLTKQVCTFVVLVVWIHVCVCVCHCLCMLYILIEFYRDNYPLITILLLFKCWVTDMGLMYLRNQIIQQKSVPSCKWSWFWRDIIVVDFWDKHLKPSLLTTAAPFQMFCSMNAFIEICQEFSP